MKDKEVKKIRDALGPINTQSFMDIRVEAESILKTPKAGKGRGRKRKGTTRDERLKAALDLFARCEDAAVPPPAALVQLLSESVGSSPDVVPADHQKPNLTPDQWKVVDLLLNSPSFHFNWEDSELPIKLSSRQVGDRIGVSHAAVMMWWKEPEFRRGLTWRISETLWESIEEETPKVPIEGLFAYLPPKGMRACESCGGMGYPNPPDDKGWVQPCSECEGAGYLPVKHNSE